MLNMDLDEYQCIGTVPTVVVERLWPDFVPQDYDLYINPVYLRRHMQNRSDYMDRCAALNQCVEEIEAALTRPYVFARYEDVDADAAGLTVYVEVFEDDEPTKYLALGSVLLQSKGTDGKPNHITTLIPPMSAKKMVSRLEKTTRCWPDGRLTSVKKTT